MTAALRFLDELVALGVIVERVGNRLRVDAPAGVLSEGIRSCLCKHKSELLEAVSPNWAADAMKVISEIRGVQVRRDLRDSYEETAATLEHQQGLARLDAEMQAFGSLLFEILGRGLL